ncbi:MAG: hypothetical protein GVY27_01575 [Deinococcus-Thermus bacterium]|jgi:hypothetical protein|nr:hypothetical protein [Deinococcota bacterium]
MARPPRPIGTACWLVTRTPLTDRQIAAYTGIAPKAVEDLRRDRAPQGTVAFNPVSVGLLTVAEIDRCAADPSADLAAPPLPRHLPGATPHDDAA